MRDPLSFAELIQLVAADEENKRYQIPPSRRVISLDQRLAFTSPVHRRFISSHSFLST